MALQDRHLGVLDVDPAGQQHLAHPGDDPGPIAADRGAFIDQSQSLNLFMANPNIGAMSSMYMYAWKRGLKTTYYLRSMGATHAEKSTSKAGALNAVSSAGVESAAQVANSAEAGIKVCAIDNPDCEACQ